MKLVVDIARVTAASILVVLALSHLWRRVSSRTGSTSSIAASNNEVILAVAWLFIGEWLVKAHQPTYPLATLGLMLVLFGWWSTKHNANTQMKSVLVELNLLLGVILLGIAALTLAGPFLIKSPGPHIRHSAWGFGSLIAVSYIATWVLIRRSPIVRRESEDLKV